MSEIKWYYKKQDKSDHWVVVPLRMKLFYLHREFERIIPKYRTVILNYYIKEVAKIAGIDQLIKFSHKKGNRDIITLKPNMPGLPRIPAVARFVQMNF
jgi:hypothetical protein